MNKKRYIKKNAVFLDRDGTINYDYGYVSRFSNFKFRPHVINGLKYLSKKKYLIFIVTNQAGLAKGKFKLNDLILLHKKLKIFLRKRKIVINDIEYCPYHPHGIVKKYKKKSEYRKPGNKMILKLIKKWKINKKRSFMLGDKNSDKQAAKKSNLYYEHVKGNFYNQVKKIDKKVLNNY
tara:strand:- start:511 stop:1044 length:534 start_codon:yes stop_codon:yes gene_type:complete